MLRGIKRVLSCSCAAGLFVFCAVTASAEAPYDSREETMAMQDVAQVKSDFESYILEMREEHLPATRPSGDVEIDYDAMVKYVRYTAEELYNALVQNTLQQQLRTPLPENYLLPIAETEKEYLYGLFTEFDGTFTYTGVAAPKSSNFQKEYAFYPDVVDQLVAQYGLEGFDFLSVVSVASLSTDFLYLAKENAEYLIPFTSVGFYSWENKQLYSPAEIAAALSEVVALSNGESYGGPGSGENAPGSAWTWVLAGGILFAGLIVGVVIFIRKKRRST